MTSYVFLLCIVVAWVCYTRSLPLPTLSGIETHTFRWAIEADLNGTNCAAPNITVYFPNDTLLVDPDSSTLHDSLILLNAVFSQEDQQVICHGNNSLFVLVGNPGMIWHPLTGQCVHSKMMNISASVPGEDNRVIYEQRKTLIISSQCETNNSNVAVFKYDKNKFEGLVFLQDVNSAMATTEEWCIGTLAGTIEVKPKCGFDSDVNMNISSVVFQEIF
ncbi:unnamed protein product [Rotaria magnacalcarata]|uniref:Uncharacterized protein n=2 Tax=Rotaria magnacalcarata TaxID=392030 RepID=A0A814YWA9_9BILA|nr:unnamed protein product [Rotaria magnacalcarata]CAF4140228.1 unnamed protein product [Rotaria magnacalcarata]